MALRTKGHKSSACVPLSVFTVLFTKQLSKQNYEKSHKPHTITHTHLHKHTHTHTNILAHPSNHQCYLGALYSPADGTKVSCKFYQVLYNGAAPLRAARTGWEGQSESNR